MLAVLAVGCGGEDRLSRDEYVARLNEMCRDFGAREREIGEPRTLADVAERGDEVARAFEQAIAQPVQSLAAPDELVAEAEELRAIAREQLQVLADLSEAARGGSRAQELVARNRALNAEAEAIVRRLGAADCL